MMVMTYDLIIYDCDGTLVNTERIVNEAFVSSLHRHGYTQFDVDYILNECFGRTVPGILARMAEDVGHELSWDIVTDYQKIVPNYLASRLQPDTEQIGIVARLGTEFKNCVASNGLRATVGAAIQAAGLGRIFNDQNIFVSADVPRAKPYPDLFHHAARTMDATRPVAIEDSPVGLKGAVNAGFAAIGFTGHAPNKKTAAELLTKAGALIVVETWPDVEAFLRPKR